MTLSDVMSAIQYAKDRIKEYDETIARCSYSDLYIRLINDKEELLIQINHLENKAESLYYNILHEVETT